MNPGLTRKTNLWKSLTRPLSSSALLKRRLTERGESLFCSSANTTTSHLSQDSFVQKTDCVIQWIKTDVLVGVHCSHTLFEQLGPVVLRVISLK